ncbi:hypothetical protein FGG08_000399 [Glutinoglossum americanum]|uniref:HTH APSES-type domain-containing protein n=1 Tax=Glutinoglossum americanum TaxID=1670608 RepID=A0A9P8IDI2_9PEZI|nr:hypothetical protein FGG08_000399 [Glutinoglossum americanum]
MLHKRPLPERSNPLLAPDKTPLIADLVGRRRLGQTNLSKPGHLSATNTPRPQNSGTFDYAHLRAPLPKDLSGSGVFQDSLTPESYFLMRRSSDGYVSATGMFKASFPWASQAEEEAERRYIKTLDTTSLDETAGNVWINPSHALELAEEYGIVTWIKALLDNKEIETGSGTGKSISPPPQYLAVPASAARGRARRSVSPSKIATPHKKLASPRKRNAKAVNAFNAASEADAHAASATLQEALNKAASAAFQPLPNEGEEHPSDGERVKVEVGSTVQVNGDVETKHTTVKVELPSDPPNFPLPESTSDMIAKAKEMVEEARKLEIDSSAKKTMKRKVEEVEEDDGGSDMPKLKKTKGLEEALKREKVKTKALIGLSATLAIG